MTTNPPSPYVSSAHQLSSLRAAERRRKMRDAVQMELEGMAFKDICKALSISRVTFWRWRKKAFYCALRNELREQVKRQSYNMVVANTPAILTKLIALTESANEHVRLQACQAFLKLQLNV